mmetsp:Transcript_31805/g.75944  ORF Transcript_31805/g.75944 Transcript_31805/m.75944 type:complete len:285 (-) Transcript_31805:45-899(-)
MGGADASGAPPKWNDRLLGAAGAPSAAPPPVDGPADAPSCRWLNSAVWTRGGRRAVSASRLALAAWIFDSMLIVSFRAGLLVVCASSLSASLSPVTLSRLLSQALAPPLRPRSASRIHRQFGAGRLLKIGPLIAPKPIRRDVPRTLSSPGSLALLRRSRGFSPAVARGGGCAVSLAGGFKSSLSFGAALSRRTPGGPGSERVPGYPGLSRVPTARGGSILPRRYHCSLVSFFALPRICSRSKSVKADRVRAPREQAQKVLRRPTSTDAAGEDEDRGCDVGYFPT